MFLPATSLFTASCLVSVSVRLQGLFVCTLCSVEGGDSPSHSAEKLKLKGEEFGENEENESSPGNVSEDESDSSIVSLSFQDAVACVLL